MSRKAGVIVIGGHVQALGIIRIFGTQNIQVIVLDRLKINIAKHSKYCTEFHHYDENCLIPKLLNIAQNPRYKNWLVLPTKDEHVRELSINRSRLSEFFTIGTDIWEHVEKCYNKKQTYQIAMDIGIDIPLTYFPNSLSDLKSINIQFPCIIKPAIMHSFYSKYKKKVFVCYNPNDLIDKYNLAIQAISKEEVLLQEIVPGSSEHQYSVGMLYFNGKIISSIVVRRARQHPPDFGNATTFAVTTQNRIIHDQAEKLLEKIKYSGICEVEFKYDQKEKKYKLLEINPRTWKWHLITEKAKIPILINYYNLIFGYPLLKNENLQGIAFKHLITDFPTKIIYMIKGIYKNHKYEHVQMAVWDINDLKPAIAQLLYLPYFILSR